MFFAILIGSLFVSPAEASSYLVGSGGVHWSLDRQQTCYVYSGRLGTRVASWEFGSLFLGVHALSGLKGLGRSQNYFSTITLLQAEVLLRHLLHDGFYGGLRLGTGFLTEKNPKLTPIVLEIQSQPSALGAMIGYELFLWNYLHLLFEASWQNLFPSSASFLNHTLSMPSMSFLTLQSGIVLNF